MQQILTLDGIGIEVEHINQHAIPGRLTVSFRSTDAVHSRTEPLAPPLRKEAYFVWEQSQDLRSIAHAPSAMHPADWLWADVCWCSHAPIDHILASRGYADFGC